MLFDALKASFDALTLEVFKEIFWVFKVFK